MKHITSKAKTPLSPLAQPCSLNDRVYRLTGMVSSFDCKRPVLNLRLSCTKGDLHAQVWPQCTKIPENITHLSLIKATGHKVSKGSQEFYVMKSISLATVDELNRTPLLHSLPRSFCSDPTALDDLVRFIESLESDLLKEFVRRVLERRDVVEPFLKVPASFSYHHNEPMGLLKHSLQVARGVSQQISCFDPDMPPFHRDLAVVGG